MGFFSRPNGDWLVKRFGPRIRIEVGDDAVVFTHQSRVVSLPPRLYLRGRRIVGAGLAPAGEAAEELDVFTGVYPETSPEQVLAKLISIGISQVLGRTFTIRPNVELIATTTRCPTERILKALDLAGVRNVTIRPL